MVCYRPGMEEGYVFRVLARRPAIYVVTMVFAGLLTLAFHEGAPWFFYLPVVLGGSLLLFPLMKNRVDGLSLAPDYLTLGAWRAPQTVRVHLKSGGIVTAFPGDIPPREPFAAALARLGIPLEIS